MTWRKAGDRADELAKELLRDAEVLCPLSDPRADQFRAYLHRYPDKQALAAWARRRKAQHLAEFGGECRRRSDTDDVTVKERGPKS